MSDPFLWATVILGIWGALGPLVGVRYGSELAATSQKQHWTRDNVRQECRELIAVMSSTYSVYMKYHSPTSLPGVYGPHNEGEQRAFDQALKDSLAIFYRMLFIREELLSRNIRERWISALRDFETSKNATDFSVKFGTIAREIGQIAEDVID